LGGITGYHIQNNDATYSRELRKRELMDENTADADQREIEQQRLMDENDAYGYHRGVEEERMLRVERLFAYHEEVIAARKISDRRFALPIEDPFPRCNSFFYIKEYI